MVHPLQQDHPAMARPVGRKGLPIWRWRIFEEIGEANRSLFSRNSCPLVRPLTHLAPYGSQIYGDGTTARLPFGLTISPLDEDDFITQHDGPR